MPLTGNAFILLITKETDKKAIIKKDKKTTPNALKFDLIFKTCLVETIKEANIHNWVNNITGKDNSGVTPKNLIKPGVCAYPTAIKIFLNSVFVSLSGKILTPIT